MSSDQYRTVAHDASVLPLRFEVTKPNNTEHKFGFMQAPWNIFVRMCNVTAKVGLIAFAPVEVRPTGELQIDTISAHLLQAPKTMLTKVSHALNNPLLQQFSENIGWRKKGKRCAAMEVESIVPQKVENLTL